MNTSVIQPLLQRALDLMETAARWERRAAKKAYICGLQGEKRRLRYLYREAQNIVDWIEYAAEDDLKLDICAKEGSVDVSSLLCPMSTMNGVIEKLWTIYGNIRSLVNEIIAANFKDFSVPLDKYACELFAIIGELQRTQSEYEKAKYEYHHISRYQVGWENVHDKYEAMEEKQGYKDYK